MNTTKVKWVPLKFDLMAKKVFRNSSDTSLIK